MLNGTLPKKLTEADWKSKKGLIAKMAGETGIGEALSDLHKAWVKVNWKVVEPDSAAVAYARPGQAITGDDWEAWQKTVRKEQFGKLLVVARELKAFNDLAKDLEKKWATSKKIPSSSTAHLRSMLAEVQPLATEISGIPKKWSDRVAAMKLLDAQKLAGVRQMLKPAIKKVRDEGKKVYQNPILPSYGFGKGTGFHQDVRALSAALGSCKIPRVVAWNQQHFMPFAQDNYAPTHEKELAPKVKAILQSLDTLEALLA